MRGLSPTAGVRASAVAEIPLVSALHCDAGCDRAPVAGLGALVLTIQRGG